MQITVSSLVLSLAVACASAAPSRTLEARQTFPSNVPIIKGAVWFTFYPEDNCTGAGSFDRLIFDNGLGICHPEDGATPNIPGIPKYKSWKIWQNNAVHPLNLYTRDDCTTAEGGNLISVPAGVVGCFTQQIGSTRFIV